MKLKNYQPKSNRIKFVRIERYTNEVNVIITKHPVTKKASMDEGVVTTSNRVYYRPDSIGCSIDTKRKTIFGKFTLDVSKPRNEKPSRIWLTEIPFKNMGEILKQIRIKQMMPKP